MQRRFTAWLVPELGVALVFLALYVGGFMLQCRKAQLPAAFDPGECHYPVRVEDITVSSPGQFRFVVEGWRAGQQLDWVGDDGGQGTVTLVPAAGPGLLVVTAASGVFFWTVGLFVFVPRIREPAVPLFFWILLLYGLGVMIGGVFFRPQPISWTGFFALLQVICLALLPPLFLQLTLTFPRRLPGLMLRRVPQAVPWLMAIVLIAWQAWAFGRYFAEPVPTRGSALVGPERMADIFMLVVVGFGFINLVRQLRGPENGRQVRQIRWIIWGFAVGAAPYLVLRTLPLLLGLPAPLPAGADRVLEMAIPLAFVFAVVREQFLDIDVIIRRSVLYSLLAAVILGLMVVPSLVLTWSFGELRPNAYRLALLGGGLTAGVLFNPLRRLIGRTIDRWFFHLRQDDDALLDDMKHWLQLALAPADVGVVIEPILARWFGAAKATLDLAVPEWIAAVPANGVLAASEATDSPDLESAAYPGAWLDAGDVVAFAVGGDRVPIGWLRLGVRRSGRRYLRSELELGRRCAWRVAQALERLRLIHEKAAETQARERLDELNRMKSDFLAQVAHDLRTPVASVTWSTRNLLDGLAGEVNAKQTDYLNSVADASSHLEALVSNLLELSRLEDPALVLELYELDPAECVVRAASTVRPLARSATVELVVHVQDPPRVRAHADKLLECLVNMLDNAVKYSPPAGVVELSVSRTAAGDCAIAITDNGPGLKGTGDVFGRFVQGPRSPFSPRRGFGLGLYVVRQYAEMMGGHVAAANRPDGGACFTLTLPAAIAAVRKEA